MPPRRPTTVTPGIARRPRVAGLVPVTGRPAAPDTASPTPDQEQPIAEVPAAEVPAAEEPPAEEPPAEEPPAEEPESQSAPVAGVTVPAGAPVPVAGATAPIVAPSASRRVGRALRARPVLTLGIALAVLSTLAGGAAVADHIVRHTPAATNTALADVGTTSDVLGQVNSALETVYSYDFTKLDENERLARQVITPAFAERYEKLFAQVRALAPQQQAVVSATVSLSAVRSIDGDRAVVVAFLDQEATRANPGAQAQQLNAAGRLTVTAERDGEAWKIADVANR